jgi:hypothetical protein
VSPTVRDSFDNASYRNLARMLKLKLAKELGKAKRIVPMYKSMLVQENTHHAHRESINSTK